MKDVDPAEVVSFSLRAIPPGLTAADMKMKIDAATRARMIDGAVAKLNEFYVFPETAKKMAEAVQARLKSGAYDAVTGADDFAATLTDDLQAVSHDIVVIVGVYCDFVMSAAVSQRARHIQCPVTIEKKQSSIALGLIPSRGAAYVPVLQ